MPDTKLSRAVNMMIRTSRMHKSMIDACVGEIGVHRTQHIILMNLAKCDKLPSQKELAERLEITQAAVTGALKSMEQSGYIERTLGHDNRYNEIKITERGRELVADTQKLFSEVDVVAFQGFSDEELDGFISCLEKMQANMKKQFERKNNT